MDKFGKRSRYDSQVGCRFYRSQVTGNVVCHEKKASFGPGQDAHAAMIYVQQLSTLWRWLLRHYQLGYEGADPPPVPLVGDPHQRFT